jgi:hypothetical protein
MKFERYTSTDSFAADTFEILMEHEVLNKSLINVVNDKIMDMKNELQSMFKEKGWENEPYIASFNDKYLDDRHFLLATVKGADGGILLTVASCPINGMAIYETGNKPDEQALQLLSDELKQMNFKMDSITAEQGLAQRFAEAHGVKHKMKSAINIMRLDAVNDVSKTSGRCRLIQEDDLYFTPYWTQACFKECGQNPLDVRAIHPYCAGRLADYPHLIWEDGHPVAQAANSNKTPNGAVIGDVYTPPYYRGKGYATSVVAELSRMLLEHGSKFCALYVNAENHTASKIYRNIGYYDLYATTEIVFEE